MFHHPKEKKVKRYLKRYNSNIIMFHHRNPTSTINVKKACHPFSTRNYFGDTEYILIHNGYIWNDDDLFVKHSQEGIEYQSLLPDLTFNDSESLLWEFALYMQGKNDKVEAKGGIAFVCAKLVDGELTDLYFARNKNPLYMLKNKKGLYLASEGEGEMIDSETLYGYNYKDDSITKTAIELMEYSSLTKYGSTANSGFKSNTYDDAVYPYGASFRGVIDNDEEEIYGYYENGVWIPKSACTQVYHDPATGQQMIMTDDGRRIVRKPALASASGNWIGDSLRERFDVEEISDYIEDENGNMKEVTIHRIVPKSQSNLSFRNDILLPESKPETLIMQYLIKSSGHYQDAYDAIEHDYIDSFSKFQSERLQSKQRMYEQSMEILDGNEEWKNGKEVSSLWSALFPSKKKMIAA